MKKFLIGLSGFIFIATSFGLTFDQSNSNQLFMQKNFKEINSSTDYIDRSSSFTDPITLNPLNTPRVTKKNSAAVKKAIKAPNNKSKGKAQSISKKSSKKKVNNAKPKGKAKKQGNGNKRKK